MIEIAGLAFAALAIMFGGLLKGAVGMGAPQDPKDAAPPTPVDAGELAALLASRRPELLALIGGGGLVLLVALMELKPG